MIERTYLIKGQYRYLTQTTNFSKVIALRFQSVLPQIINNHQKGFLKDIHITKLMKRIDDITNAKYLTNTTNTTNSTNCLTALSHLLVLNYIVLSRKVIK